MTLVRGNFGYFFLFVLLGAILGSALGTLAVRYVPGLAVLTANLTGPVGFSLEIISFSLRLNLSAILGIIAGIILFRKI